MKILSIRKWKNGKVTAIYYPSLRNWNYCTMKRTQESPRTNYCFTYNNYTPDGEQNLKDWLVANTKYSCFGHEIAPTTGTPHLQGFFSLIKKDRTSSLQKKFIALGIDLALIYAKGTSIQNRTYCSKADPTGFFEHGECKKASQGARNDLMDVVDYVKKAPRTIEDVAESFPCQFIKYNRGLKDFKNIMDKKNVPDQRDVTVSVFYGEGGTGKTHYAVALCERFRIPYYILSAPDSNTVWWDNYDGEKAIIIDDFYGWIKPHELYRICDRYKYKVAIKGSFLHAQWLWVFITSNNEPRKFYKEETYNRLDQTAFNRRFHNVYYWEYYDEQKNSCVPLTREKDERPILQKMSEARMYPATQQKSTKRLDPIITFTNIKLEIQVTMPQVSDEIIIPPGSPDLADFS